MKKKINILIGIMIGLLLFTIIFLINANITGLSVIGEGILKASPDPNVNLKKPVFSELSNIGILLILFLFVVIFIIAISKRKPLNKNQKT